MRHSSPLQYRFREGAGLDPRPDGRTAGRIGVAVRAHGILRGPHHDAPHSDVPVYDGAPELAHGCDDQHGGCGSRLCFHRPRGRRALRARDCRDVWFHRMPSVLLWGDDRLLDASHLASRCDKADDLYRGRSFSISELPEWEEHYTESWTFMSRLFFWYGSTGIVCGLVASAFIKTHREWVRNRPQARGRTNTPGSTVLCRCRRCKIRSLHFVKSAFCGQCRWFKIRSLHFVKSTFWCRCWRCKIRSLHFVKLQSPSPVSAVFSHAFPRLRGKIQQRLWHGMSESPAAYL